MTGTPPDTSKQVNFDAHSLSPEGWHSSLRFFVPGRVNLVGEHLDYNGGRSLPFAIDRGIRFELDEWRGPLSHLHTDGDACAILLSSAASDLGTDQVLAVDLRAQPSGAKNIPGDPYLRGACALAQELWSKPHPGLWRIRCSSDLPLGAGLSSSAAYSLGLVSCLSMIFGHRFHDWLTPALAAQHIEHRFAGTPCGLMDQLAILATPKGCYLDLDFGDETSRKSSGQGVSFALAPFTSVPQVTPRPFCPSLRDDYRVVLFNTGRKHQLSDGSYATRREECQAALQGLLSGQPLHRGPTKAEPPATTLGDWFRRLPTWAQGDLVHAEDQALEAIEASLQDPLLRRRAVFVAQEILRVEQTIQAMANDAPATIDAVLRRAQAGLRDDYEISCPEVDLAVDLIGAAKSSLHLQTPSTAPLIIGPRMMGGGWGGSLILWIKTSAHGAILDALNDVAQRYSISSGCQAELIETCPERGLAEPWPWSSGASQTKVHQPV